MDQLERLENQLQRFEQKANIAEEVNQRFRQEVEVMKESYDGKIDELQQQLDSRKGNLVIGVQYGKHISSHVGVFKTIRTDCIHA